MVVAHLKTVTKNFQGGRSTERLTHNRLSESESSLGSTQRIAEALTTQLKFPVPLCELAVTNEGRKLINY